MFLACRYIQDARRLFFSARRPGFRSRSGGNAAGFTLTEATIVFGIIGAVLSGVWAAANSFREEVKVKRALEQYAIVSNNIRKIGPAVGTSFAWDTPTGYGSWYFIGVVNKTLIKMDVFPSDMVDRNLNAVINPWQPIVGSYPNAVVITTGTYMPSEGYSLPGGQDPSMGGFDPSTAAPVDAFEIMFSGIPTPACVRLAMGLAGAGKDPQIASVLINSWSNPITTFPLTIAQATQYCNPNNNMMAAPSSSFYRGFNSINVVYKF